MSKRVKFSRTSERPVTLKVTPFELLILQDATDDLAGPGGAGAGAKGAAAARLRALQRKLHTLTGEELPPTQAAQRASLRRVLKGGPQ